MSNIPLARHRLQELAKSFPEIERDVAEILPLLSREPYERNPRCPSAKMTWKLAERIRFAKSDDPLITSQELANRFGVNNGRVSEAITYRKYLPPRWYMRLPLEERRREVQEDEV